MPISSERIRENVELDEKWKPKRNILNFFSHTAGQRRTGRYDFFELLRGIFESLMPLWILLFLFGVVSVMVAIIYFFCEYLPKH